MDTSFINETIDVNTLPKYEEVAMQSLDPHYKRIMWINFWISTLVFTIIVSIPAWSIFWGDWKIALFYIPVLLIQGINLVLMNRSFSSKQYAIRTHDVIYKSGIINQQSTIIPFSNIQHVATQESWLARKYKLAKIELFTTGDSLAIPGLPADMAYNIKALVLNKISNKKKIEDTIPKDPISQESSSDTFSSNTPHSPSNDVA